MMADDDEHERWDHQHSNFSLREKYQILVAVLAVEWEFCELRVSLTRSLVDVNYDSCQKLSSLLCNQVSLVIVPTSEDVSLFKLKWIRIIFPKRISMEFKFRCGDTSTSPIARFTRAPHGGGTKKTLSSSSKWKHFLSLTIFKLWLNVILKPNRIKLLQSNHNRKHHASRWHEKDSNFRFKRKKKSASKSLSRECAESWCVCWVESLIQTTQKISVKSAPDRQQQPVADWWGQLNLLPKKTQNGKKIVRSYFTWFVWWLSLSLVWRWGSHVVEMCLLCCNEYSSIFIPSLLALTLPSWLGVSRSIDIFFDVTLFLPPGSLERRVPR